MTCDFGGVDVDISLESKELLVSSHPLPEAGLEQPPSNQIQVLAPYWEAGTWVFDDERTGLVKEPFVSGVPTMIDNLVQEIPEARSGFRLLFSTTPFPGFQRKLSWLREEMGGNWYRSDQPEMEGWLCPALFKYFAAAPATLFVKAEPLTT